jgi:hypothetical protein
LRASAHHLKACMVAGICYSGYCENRD